jgi:hypothetical protein
MDSLFVLEYENEFKRLKFVIDLSMNWPEPVSRPAQLYNLSSLRRLALLMLWARRMMKDSLLVSSTPAFYFLLNAFIILYETKT